MEWVKNVDLFLYFVEEFTKEDKNNISKTPKNKFQIIETYTIAFEHLKEYTLINNIIEFRKQYVMGFFFQLILTRSNSYL